MMDIKNIDKNFQLKPASVLGDMAYYSIPDGRFPLYGVFLDETEGFLRMPIETAKTVSEGVSILTKHTAGGRLRFSTDSDVFELKIAYDGLWPMPHMTVVGQGGFILLEETDEGRRLVKIFPPDFSDNEGYWASVPLKGDKVRDYILFFPLYNPVKSLTIGLRVGAKVGNGRAYRDEKPILYYGSSITQGGCASRPDNCYQAWIEKWNNIDFINLGFSGNAKGEDEMTDYLAGIDCSVFVCDYDYNAPDAAHLRKTHYRLYERYRNKRTDTPILFISAPNPFGGEGERERAKIVRETYERAKRSGDENVYFLLGRTIFGKNAENCTVDGCHPNDLGFYRMAKKIYKKLIEINVKFK